ncbi:protein of unknown function [Cyanobium sp. NIES-981]|nr:protein of unknown function [Cyanobium sp. NIES-981]
MLTRRGGAGATRPSWGSPGGRHGQQGRDIGSRGGPGSDPNAQPQGHPPGGGLGAGGGLLPGGGGCGHLPPHRPPGRVGEGAQPPADRLHRRCALQRRIRLRGDVPGGSRPAGPGPWPESVADRHGPPRRPALRGAGGGPRAGGGLPPLGIRAGLPHPALAAGGQRRGAGGARAGRTGAGAGGAAAAAGGAGLRRPAGAEPAPPLPGRLAGPSGRHGAGPDRCWRPVPWLRPHPPLPAAPRQRLADRSAAGRRPRAGRTAAAGDAGPPSRRGADRCARRQPRGRRADGAPGVPPHRHDAADVPRPPSRGGTGRGVRPGLPGAGLRAAWRGAVMGMGDGVTIPLRGSAPEHNRLKMSLTETQGARLRPRRSSRHDPPHCHPASGPATGAGPRCPRAALPLHARHGLPSGKL